MPSELILCSPGRILFSVWNFDIYIYGCIIAVSVLLGVCISNFLADKSGKLSQGIIINLAPLIIICGLIGARLWYCSLSFDLYINSPLEILNFRTGGMSIHGAILGGFLGLLFFAFMEKVNIKTLCDYAAPGLAIGQSIGRWGNFFNNEAFGYPTDGIIKLYIPPHSRPEQFLGYNFFHPAFLYESLADFAIFLVLIYFLKKSELLPDGCLALIYLCLYSLVRFLIELLRLDCSIYIFNLPFPAFVSLVIFLVSLPTLLYYLTKRYN